MLYLYSGTFDDFPAFRDSLTAPRSITTIDNQIVIDTDEVLTLPEYIPPEIIPDEPPPDEVI